MLKISDCISFRHKHFGHLISFARADRIEFVLPQCRRVRLVRISAGNFNNCHFANGPLQRPHEVDQANAERRFLARPDAEDGIWE